MLIVKSGLPGNPLVTIELTERDALVIVPELVRQCRSFYFEPLPFNACVLKVDPEHADYIFKRIEELP